MSWVKFAFAPLASFLTAALICSTVAVAADAPLRARGLGIPFEGAPGPSNAITVVAETWDGWLNDLDGFHVQAADAIAAIEAAPTGPVAEGNVGGGTGMVCFGFKGGMGTSSRKLSVAGKDYIAGVLVQCNTGDRQ